MTEILKLLEPIFSIFVGHRQMFSDKSIQLTKEILNQLRKVVSLVAMLFGSLVLLCLGMSYFISRTLDQLDKGSFALTPSLIFLLIFMLICIGFILYSTSKKTWIQILNIDQENELNDRERDRQKMTAEHSNPIEAAISLFILDLVKEREMNREKEKNTEIVKAE